MRLDTDWQPYIGAALFEAVPEPTSIALLGLAAVGLSRRRRSK